MSNLDHKIKTAAEKPPLDLLPLRALIGAARAFQHGTIKYEIGNYLRADPSDATTNRYGGALLRHLADMQGLDGVFSEPEMLDAESGLPHIDHAIATLVMLRAILIDSGRLPVDPGQSRFVRGLAAREAGDIAPTAPPPTRAAIAHAQAGFSPATQGVLDRYAAYVATLPLVTDDAYWQRHPLGSPERVQAVEDHRAAVEASK